MPPDANGLLMILTAAAPTGFLVGCLLGLVAAWRRGWRPWL